MDIYCDGATSKNGSKDAQGGWAFIVVDEDGGIVMKNSGHVECATNNICELLAAINACDAVRATPYNINVYLDSAYIVNCYKDKWYKKWQVNGWRNSKNEPVANKELWQQLIPFFENDKYSFNKVKGHSGNYYNEIVDEMAVEAKFYGKYSDSSL